MLPILGRKLAILAKMANFRPKIGQDATFAPTLHEHNSAILSDLDVRLNQNN